MPKRELPFDLDVEGVTAKISANDPRVVILSLCRPRQMFSGRDKNTYVHGQVKRNSTNPGSVETQTLGLALADLPVVMRVQFPQNFDAAIKLRYTPERAKATLRRASTMLLDAADAHEARQRHPADS